MTSEQSSTSTAALSWPASREEWQAALTRPGVVLFPLRMFLGITFTFAGLQKLADPHFFQASRATSIQAQLVLFHQTSPIRFMLGPIQHHAVLFGAFTAIVEMGVGLGTLLGLWSRAAACIGALLALSFFLTVSWKTRPYYYGSDIVFVFAWTPFILAGAGGVLSLDAWRRRDPGTRAGDPVVEDGPAPLFGRRAVVATGAVAAGGLVLAGLDAAIGRGAAHDNAAAAAGNGVVTLDANATTIATAAKVDAAGGVEFRQPATGDPAWLVATGGGTYKAFTAVCTHQGCTVNFAKKSAQFQCPCHGGIYDAKTGEVLSGPPPAPLAAIAVKNVNGEIRLA